MVKKVLILGVTGTLGHKIAQELIKDKRLIVYGTYNQRKKYNLLKSYLSLKKFYNVDTLKSIVLLIKSKKFDFVINCIGLIKQKKFSKKKYFDINKKLPLEISKLSLKYNFKMIHFSTDCVFNGKKGNYKEDDYKNAVDFYGISKSEGEPTKEYTNSLTLRTSFIGHEIFGNYSLLDWLLTSKKKINGFRECYFNGLTSFEISKIIYKIILKKYFINGLFHLSGKKINKFSLLKLINKVYSLKKDIKKVSKPKINRTLNNNKFKKYFSYKEKNWNILIKELYQDYIENKNLYKNL